MPVAGRVDSVVPIHVSDHARERARERFPGFKAARIVDEVRVALREGRISADKPPGFGGDQDGARLYVWNEQRAYVLKACDNGFVVTTTVPR